MIVQQNYLSRNLFGFPLEKEVHIGYSDNPKSTLETGLFVLWKLSIIILGLHTLFLR